MTAATSLIQPRKADAFDHITDMCKSETKTILDGIVTGTGWVPYTNASPKTAAFAKKVGDALDPVKLAHAIPEFFIGVENLRRAWTNWNSTDDPDLTRRTVNYGLGTINAGTESLKFVQASKIYAFKETTLALCEKVFWITAGLLEGIDFFHGLDEASYLQKQIDASHDVEVKNLNNSKLTNTYLKLVASVTTIAMAFISLVSLFFATFAVGFLFSPIVFQSLATAWVLIKLTTLFYDRSIAAQEKQMLPGKV